MEFGWLLHARQLIRSEDAAKSFDRLWSDAAEAEELGFDHIWLGDSVTVLDKARGDCLTTMAGLAARTEKIRLGAVPMLAALRNPVLLAHALATIDVISKGRVIIGVSVGPTRDYIQRQFAAWGVPPQEKAGRLSECIEIMRRLWSEKTIDYDGRYYKLHDVGILPHPAERTGIPILDRRRPERKRIQARRPLGRRLGDLGADPGKIFRGAWQDRSIRRRARARGSMPDQRALRVVEPSNRRGAREDGRLALDGKVFRTAERKTRALFYRFRHAEGLRAPP